MTASEDAVAAEARAAGFALVGAAPLGPLERGAFLHAWLAEGRAGEMAYLARRTAERIDPRTAFPWARSVIAVGAPYRPPPPPPEDWRATLRGRIAAYAFGPDYHDGLGDRLAALGRRLADVFPGRRFLHYVDTGPVLEREWAARAGLGWIGRNTLLLDRGAGSYLFLGELFTDLELGAPEPAPDRCGTCVRCHAACPTGALGPGYTMDPRRCISYLTIEHRSAIPLDLRPLVGNWIFGCDVCQEVCPWNGGAASPPTDVLAPHLPSLLALDEAGFRTRYRHTAVARAKRRGLLRNVAVALGNSGNPDAVGPLAAALADPEPLVRAHAAWALGRLGGPGARRALDAARTREPAPRVRDEIAAALATIG
ncbi:MAG TPA: tRNA epoxyqueuosine(34) reductase QueG [Candidatus Binatia bacterium]|nr:tRNA epoxyqueuosine(34) reductase QueG [Candidatus Binatia bacterium]